MPTWTTWLPIFIMCVNMLIRQSKTESVDELLYDCQQNTLKRKVCFSYGLFDLGTHCAEDAFSAGTCSAWLRTRIPEEHFGEWRPPIELTVAFVNKEQASKPFWKVFIAFEMKDDSEPIVLKVIRYENGTFAYTSQLNQPLFTFTQSGKPWAWGNETSIVFTIIIPSTVIVSGYERETLSLITDIGIASGFNDNFYANPRVYMTKTQRNAIQSNPGYKYAGCEAINLACLSIPTHHLGETEKCLDKNDCENFVRIRTTDENQILVYLSRLLPSTYTGYISVGFSINRSMGKALVFDCIKGVSSTKTATSYNEGHENSPYSFRFTSRHEMSPNGKYLECFWVIYRDVRYATPGFPLNLESNSYHIVRAIGDIGGNSIVGGANGKMKHQNAAVTQNKIRFTSQTIYEETETVEDFVKKKSTRCTLTHGCPVATTTRNRKRFFSIFLLVIVTIAASILGTAAISLFHMLKYWKKRSKNKRKIRKTRRLFKRPN